jgi:hypothetical protein
MSLTISTKEDIQTYFDSPNVSQSELKMYLGTHEEILYRMEKKTEPKRILFIDEAQHNLIGTAVDVKLTGTETMFDELFYISTSEKPSELVTSIIKNAIKIARENNKSFTSLDDLQNELITSCNNHNYQPKWKDETKINYILKYSDYFNELIINDSKYIISIEDLNLVDTLVDKFTHYYSSIFNRLMINDNSDVEVYYQKPIYVYMNGQNCKALIDVLIHDKINDKFTIIDIKTTGDLTSNFVNSYYKFGYNYQIAFYKEAVSRVFNTKKINCEFLVGSKITYYIDSFHVDNESIKNTFTGLNERHSIDIDNLTGEIISGKTKKEYEGISTLIDKYSFYKDFGFNSKYYGSEKNIIR